MKLSSKFYLLNVYNYSGENGSVQSRILLKKKKKKNQLPAILTSNTEKSNRLLAVIALSPTKYRTRETAIEKKIRDFW